MSTYLFAFFIFLSWWWLALLFRYLFILSWKQKLNSWLLLLIQSFEFNVFLGLFMCVQVKRTWYVTETKNWIEEPAFPHWAQQFLRSSPTEIISNNHKQAVTFFQVQVYMFQFFSVFSKFSYIFLFSHAWLVCLVLSNCKHQYTSAVWQQKQHHVHLYHWQSVQTNPNQS